MLTWISKWDIQLRWSSQLEWLTHMWASSPLDTGWDHAPKHMTTVVKNLFIRKKADLFLQDNYMCWLDQQFHVLCCSPFRNLPLCSRLNLLSLKFHKVLDFAICSIWDPGILGQNLNILDLPDALQTYLKYLLIFLLLLFHLPIPNMTVFGLTGTSAISMPQVLPNYCLLEVVHNWNYGKNESFIDHRIQCFLFTDLSVY